MTTLQPEALRLADELCEAIAEYPEPTALEAQAAAELRRQHARITELESQLAQRFDAADMATVSAQGFRDGVASVSAQAADSVPAVSDLPPLPAPDLRDVGTKPQEIKEFLKGYATEYARTAIAARAPADSVQEDAALWHWLAEYLVGTRTDLDDEIVASETVNDLRKLVKAAVKQGEKQ